MPPFSLKTATCALLGFVLLFAGLAFGQNSPNLNYDDFTAKLTEAGEKQKPVFLFLASEESAVSKKLDSDILPTPVPHLKKSLEAYVSARINGASPEGKQVVEAYGWHRPPVFAILNGTGELFSMLDLSSMSEQLINAGTQDQLAAWLDKNALRFQHHGVRGYGQSVLSNQDPIREILAGWEKVKDKYKKESEVLLLDDCRISFDGKNRQRFHIHFIEYVGRSGSVPYFTVPVSLWQKSATFKLIRGRVITPGLHVNDLDPADIEETTGYLNAPQYNHVRSEKLLFPGVKEGSFVECEWEIEVPTQMPGQASSQWMITSGKVAALHSHAEFSAPTSADPQARVVRNSGVVSSRSDHGITTLVFDGHSEHTQPEKASNDRDLPASEYVVFSTRNTWEDIGKWFVSLADSGENRSHTAEFDRWVDEAIQGVEKGTDYERRVANAILNAMRNSFRYLGVELADSGCQPHPVAETLKNKCGDCKDLSLFLQEALKKAGVGSRFVLVNTQSVDPFEQELPRVNYFNHVLLQIGSSPNPIFADPTGALGVCILPLKLYGKGALLCSEKESTPMSFPPLDQKAASFGLDVEFKSLTGNPTPARIECSYSGFSKFYLVAKLAGNWKTAFDKHESFFLKNYFKDFEITNSFPEHADSGSDPLKVRIDAKISDVIVKSDESVLLPSFVASTYDLTRFPRRIAGREKEEPLLVTSCQMAPMTERITYPLPAGFVFNPPPGIHIDNPYFSVDRTYVTSDHKLTIVTKLASKNVPGPTRYVREADLPKDSRNLLSILTKPIILRMSPGQMLREACSSNKRDRVAELLKQGVPIEDADDNKRTPLLVAVEAGNADIVKDLIAAKANLEVRTGDDQRPLTRAIRLDHPEIAIALIEAGADINAPTAGDDLARPVNYAAARGNVALLTKLLDAGAELNSNCGEGTPFYLAVQYNHPEAVKFLLSKKPDLSLLPVKCSRIRVVHFTALPAFHAVMNGSVEMLKLLLENGIDINAVNPECGETILFYAAGWDKFAMVDFLLERGAKVDFANNDGLTPLMNAAQYGHLRIIKTLLGKGASINARDKNGATALIHAARKGLEKTVQVLVDAGADINIADLQGGTAFNYAALRGRVTAAGYLKEKGAKDTQVHLIAPKTPPPLTPAQAWALSLAAIYLQEFGHPQLVLGRVEDWDKSIETEKKVLKSVWNIFDHSSLLAELDTLKMKGHRIGFVEKARTLATMDDGKFASFLNGPLVRDNQKQTIKSLHDGYKKWQDRLGLAFDLCRYANLVCWGHRCGYVTQSEAWELLEPVARIARKDFSSWKELGENFLDGRDAWAGAEEDKKAMFQSIVEILSNPRDPNSPWNKIPWETDLSAPFTTAPVK